MMYLLQRGMLAVVVIGMMLGMLSGCAQPMSTQQATEILQPLIEKAHPLNEIYFGQGLPIATEEELAQDTTPEAAQRLQASNASYGAVSTESPYQSIDQLKEATEAVFSDNYAAQLYQMHLEGFSQEYEAASGLSGIVVYARYIEDYGMLTAARSATLTFYQGRTYDFSTLEVERSGSDYISVYIDSQAPGEEIVRVHLQAVKESDGWRLESPTY